MQELSGVENGLLGVEETDHPDCIKKFNSVDKLGEEVDVFVIFVGSDEFHDEGGGDRSQGLFLVD